MIKMKEITDFTYMVKYFCTKCNGFHKKYYTRNGKQNKSKTFQDHKEYAFELTSSELWNFQFKRTWKNNARYQERTGKAIGL